MKRLLSFAGLGFLFAAFFFAVQPVRAGGDVDQRIKTLEDELARLKGEQMELKKEATAAAAALPTFTYRPGSGIMLEGADKSWSWRVTTETHFHMPFEAGDSSVGRTRGEIFGRKFRPYMFFCINDCLYEAEWGLDNDGWGTNTFLQRGAIHTHFENINPFLPTFTFGMDISSPGNPYRQGPTITSSQLEYDMLSRNNGFNTGRTGTGINLAWNNIPLGPGRARFQWTMGSIGTGEDGTSINSDRKSFSLLGQIEPFSRTKNKWLSGLGFAMHAWFCRPRSLPPQTAYENGFPW